MFEQLTTRVIVKWTAAATMFGITLILLGLGSPGLIVVAFGFAHLWLFRPAPRPRLTDAELEAWLNGG